MTNQSNSPAIYSGGRVADYNACTLQELMQSPLPRIEWVVDQLIPGGAITCLAGRPKVGKSFIVLELAMSIASGESLFGRFEANQKRVLIISKEDSYVVLKERLGKMGVDTELNISLSTDQEIYFDNNDLLASIKVLLMRFSANVLIIDSFIRIFRGDENSSRDVTKVHKVFKQLCDEGITIIFVHHHGKEDAQRPRATGDKLRGSSDLLAMVDSLITLEKDSDRVLKVWNTHNRHAVSMKPFYVSIPTFNEGDKRFRFLNFIDAQSTQDLVLPRDMASEDIVLLLSDGIPMRQSQIVHSLLEQPRSYGETTIKRSIGKLIATRRIVTSREANLIYYSIPTETPAIEAQSPVEVEA